MESDFCIYAKAITHISCAVDSTLPLFFKSEISSLKPSSGWFVSDLVWKPEDRFYSDTAHLILSVLLSFWYPLCIQASIRNRGQMLNAHSKQIGRTAFLWSLIRSLFSAPLLLYNAYFIFSSCFGGRITTSDSGPRPCVDSRMCSLYSSG